MDKIVLLTCYFGKLPNYFPLFLDSCKRNIDINFLIITDCDYDCLPENVEIVRMSFDEVRELIQSHFDFKISLNTPYKLCDYKPAYGYVFGEYIKGYDFWGYCDLDMIFGSIRKFISPDILKSYDKIYQFGHMTLYRNNVEINTIFMKEGIPSYIDSFTTPLITVFDEINGIQKKFVDYGKRVYISRDYADITPRHYQMRLSDLYCGCSKEENNYKYQVFTFEDGHIFRYSLRNQQILRDEFVYIHLQKRHMECSITPCDKYYFCNNKFIMFDDNPVISVKVISKCNSRSLLGEIVFSYRLKKWKLKRKIKKIVSS